MIKWAVTEVSQATGISEGAIFGYFSNRGQSVKEGLTLAQVLEVMNRERVRDCGTNDPKKVQKLVAILNEAGYETPFIYVNEANEDKETK